MKKMIALLLALAALLGCTGLRPERGSPHGGTRCGGNAAICELSTMDCYYHNVAKYFEKDAQKGFLGIGKKDKRFWIEYSGVVQMGIDCLPCENRSRRYAGHYYNSGGKGAEMHGGLRVPFSKFLYCG